MPEMQNYILSAIFFLVFCCLFFFFKMQKKKKKTSGRTRYIQGIFELARSQFETFDIKLNAENAAASGFSATLGAFDTNRLSLDAKGLIPANFLNASADIYFKVRKDDEPVFYTFSSKILNIKENNGNTTINIAFPDVLRIEKKRHFVRVKPGNDDIRVIGLWPVQPGKRLPASTGEMGSPVIKYQPGMSQNLVQVENISGAGIALRLDNEKAKLDISKGIHLLCLVVYVLDNSDKPIAFWCTGEIMNVRKTEKPHTEAVIGLEFTNWAVLDQASNEIHWAHSSPSRGARPILQWVSQIEKKAQTTI